MTSMWYLFITCLMTLYWIKLEAFASALGQCVGLGISTISRQFKRHFPFSA